MQEQPTLNPLRNRPRSQATPTSRSFRQGTEENTSLPTVERPPRHRRSDESMDQAGLCGLMHTAANAVPGTLTHYGASGPSDSASGAQPLELTWQRKTRHGEPWRVFHNANAIRPAQPTLTTKCFVTGSMIFQVPLKSASTTKASPGPTSTGVPPSGVMMMRPAIMCTNS